MPPKAKEVKGKQPPPITRPSISDTTLLYVPEDALEGFQGRIEKGIHWTVVEEAGRYHRSLCCNNERPQVSFTEALENKIKNSLISGFLDEESNLTLDEQWELLPLTLWDNEKCANEEGKVCFRNRNCITDDMLKLIKKAVKAGDRNVLKEDLKAVTVLRVNDSKITTLDEGLKGYPNLINLNLCCNLISEVTMPLFPHNLKILELQSNAVRDIKQLIEHLPPNLIYLGLSRNLLTNDSVIGMLKLPQHLTALDISDNDIYELNPVLHAVASLPNLTSLILAGNPCSVCAAYARTLISLAPNLKWLDCREILSSDRSEDHFEPHPDDLRSSYFYFTIFRIMSVPPPPRVEKGTTQTFHVEFELPLLDAQRRAFLMFRRNESLTEMLPAPEDEEEWPVSKYTSLHMAESKATVDPEASSQNTDVYAPLTAKISREIKHYTIFESNRVSWNKIMNFQEPAFRIFCPDLVALRNTLRTVVTLRLVYTQTVTTKSKPLTKSSHVFKPPPPDQRVVLATIRCALRRADWSQPSQHFHWDDTLGTHDAIHWGDGDLSVLQYTQTAAKPTKGGKDLDLISVRQPVPDCLTCHFGFGSARWGHDLFSSLRMAGAPHERWGSQLEYLLSCLGYAVGIGNLWRFPYLCYRNGGGAFLIPYFLTLFICGIPLVYLETTLGQFASAGCVSVFNINPLFKGAGYAAIVLNVIAVTYFASIMSYPILYIYHSFSSPLPWQSCGNSWNTDKCTEITGNASFLTSKSGSITTPEDEFFHIRLLRMSPSINEIGGIVWPVFWCNVFCWIIVYLCICNGVKSVGKIVYFTVSFPYVVLCVMLIRGVTLPGAWQGILFYILPDWEQLKKPKVWADAATQIFYSLGPGWGGLVSMASFNKFHYNNLRSSIIIPLVNSATSIWAGFVVFSVLGFAAERAGVPVGQVATAGPGLAFVTYPAAVSLMPLPNFWAITFFVMLFFLGIDTMFVTIEAVIAGILDEFPTLRVRKKLITVLMCLALFLLSIICNTEGGLHVLGLLDAHVAIACVPIVCLLEVVAAVYTYGTRKLSYDMQFMTGQRLRPFWLVLWRYILPTILLIIIIYTLREASGLAGWSVAMASVICIPIHAGWVIYQSKGTLWRRIRDGCRPSSDWGPMDPEIRQRWIAGMTKQAGGAGLPLTDLDVSDS